MPVKKKKKSKKPTSNSRQGNHYKKFLKSIDLINSYFLAGVGIIAIRKSLGIPDSTWYHWKKNSDIFVEFSEIMGKKSEVQIGELKNSAFRKAAGLATEREYRFRYVTQEEIEMGLTNDSTGLPYKIGDQVRMLYREKQLPPDGTMLIFLLANADNDKYRRTDKVSSIEVIEKKVPISEDARLQQLRELEEAEAVALKTSPPSLTKIKG